jgi:hypothetical protein
MLLSIIFSNQNYMRGNDISAVFVLKTHFVPSDEIVEKKTALGSTICSNFQIGNLFGIDEASRR